MESRFAVMCFLKSEELKSMNMYMGASWLGPFCLQDEAQNFALPEKTRSDGK